MIRRPPRSTLFPYTTLFRSLCGRNAVQIAARRPQPLDFPEMASRLSPLGEVRHNAFMLRFATDRKSTRLNSSHQIISYAVFCLKKKNAQRHSALRPPRDTTV